MAAPGSYRKRKYKRRNKRRRRRKKRVPRLRFGMPQTRVAKLRYVDCIALNAGSNALAEHAWAINRIEAPDYTGSSTKHQPRFFDQYARLYEHYTVLGCKANIKITSPTSTVGNVGQYMGLMGTTDIPYIQAPNADIPSLMEIPSLKRTLRKVHTDPTRTKALTWYWSAKKKGIDTTSLDAKGDTDGTRVPQVTEYLNLFVGNGGLIADGGTDDPVQLTMLVTLDFIVRFDTLKQNYPVSHE